MRFVSIRSLLLISLLPFIAFSGALARPSAVPPPRSEASNAGTFLTPDGSPIRELSRGSFTPEPAEGPALIRLGAGYTLDPRAGDPEPELPAALRATAPTGAARGYFLVRFAGPITTADRDAITDQGGRILQYVPDYTLLVSLTGEARARLAASPRVVWIGLHQPAYKLSTLPQMGEPERHDLLALLFADASLEEARQRITEAGAVVVETSDNGINRILRIRLAAAGLAQIAQIPAVAWIEPHQIPQWHNDQAQWVVQTWTPGNRRLWDQGLRGAGQVVNVVDTGIRMTHYQFYDASVPMVHYGDYPTHRKVIGYWPTVATQYIQFGDESFNSYHGTHTSCTAAGNDAPNANDVRDGMAPDAKIYFCDGGGAPNPGVQLPLDLNDLYIIPYTGNSGGAARISTNSWGNAIGGAYDVMSMAADQFMWNHPDFLLFFSNGNDGGANTVGSPATAKNCVSAGGTRNGTEANMIYTSTSRGPTDDGRLKPTICSPAGLSSAYGAGDTGYTTYWGTSMASPSMAGATVLLRQYLTNGYYPTGLPSMQNAMPAPSGALLKAMAVNSADPDINGYTVPDNNVGWGRIDDDQVCTFSGDARRLALVDETRGLLTGEYVEYEIDVVAGDLPLKVALVWTDYAGSPTSAVQLVNDLNLTVSNGVESYKGNVYAGGQSQAGGSYDNRNVEECVRRNAPGTGLWTVRIDAVNVPMGPQPFALVVTGALASDAGLVTLDAATYGGTDVAGVRVVDTNAGGTVSLTLASDTEPAGETLELTSLGSLYAGSLPLSLTPAAAGDGRLSVSDGDIVTATYVDLDPPVTLAATAEVNLSGPAIADVHASAISESDITIAWNTTLPADGKLYYGTTPDLGSETEVSPILTLTHAVTMRGLSPSTLYYYDVESIDPQGNGVRDDNGGMHYTVSTDLNRDVLLVIGDSTFDKKPYYLNALARTGWTYTLWEGAQAATPQVGDRNTGMASFKAVVWQTGLEQYPPMTPEARDSLRLLNDRGSRLAIYSHDVAWAFCDPTSGFQSAETQAFVEEELKAFWQTDPTTFSQVRGYSGDPISGAYTGGIPYAPHREGAAGDEVNGNAAGGTVANVWKDNDGTADDVAIRWTGSEPVGDPLLAVWGGTPRKVSSNFFEWAHLNVGTADDVARADVLSKTLVWLIGHNHPTAHVTAPNGGEVYTGNAISITWTEMVDMGYGVGARKLYYSDNSGDRWTLITGNAGPSPFVWDVSAIPNGAQYRIRLVLEDNASPALSAADNADANFTINRPGGDTRAPAVLAGSIAVDPNPILAGGTAVLTATVSDVYTGNSNIAAAEWSIGDAPAPAGGGTPMSGAFNAPLVPVSATLSTEGWQQGQVMLWVRGQDAAGLWGNATGRTVRVNEPGFSGASSDRPLTFALYRNAPNPIQSQTVIRYDLPQPTEVELAIYDVAGRRVRLVAEGVMGPGAFAATWDGRDASGRPVGSGVYFYRLRAGAFEATRKMTRVQ